MTTKRQIIEMAYEAIGLAGYTFDLQPEMVESARRKLDAMMAGWVAKGLLLGWPIPSSPDRGDVDEDTQLPDWALEAVYLNLGPLLATAVGKQVTPMYAAMARAAKDAMMVRVVKPAERKMPGSHPMGAGHGSFLGSVWSKDPDSVLTIANQELEL